VIMWWMGLFLSSSEGSRTWLGAHTAAATALLPPSAHHAAG